MLMPSLVVLREPCLMQTFVEPTAVQHAPCCKHTSAVHVAALGNPGQVPLTLTPVVVHSSLSLQSL